jgi:hypothetical protein
MHVEHGQKLVDVSKELLVDEGTNGNAKKGEENLEPLVDTNSGLLRENEQLHYKKRKAMVEDDRNLNGNFKSPPSKRKNSSTLEHKGSKEKYDNYNTFGSPSSKRVGRAPKVLIHDRISSTKTTKQVAHAQKNSGRLVIVESEICF